MHQIKYTCIIKSPQSKCIKPESPNQSASTNQIYTHRRAHNPSASNQGIINQVHKSGNHNQSASDQGITIKVHQIRASQSKCINQGITIQVHQIRESQSKCIKSGNHNQSASTNQIYTYRRAHNPSASNQRSTVTKQDFSPELMLTKSIKIKHLNINMCSNSVMPGKNSAIALPNFATDELKCIKKQKIAKLSSNEASNDGYYWTISCHLLAHFSQYCSTEVVQMTGHNIPHSFQTT